MLLPRDEMTVGYTRRSDVLQTLSATHELQSDSSARIVNTLLIELDGLGARKAVYIIAPMNRPDMINPATCRPGRVDKLIHFDLPSAEEGDEFVQTMIQNRVFSVPSFGVQS